jgi:hypothetical protein
MYTKVGCISIEKTGLAEQSKKLEARALAEAKHLIESVDEMKRDLLGFLRKFQ